MYNLLKEMKDEQKKLIEKSSEHREETLKWQASASSRLDNIEVDLREHKEGVIQNRESMKIFDKRLNKIEEPSKVRSFLYKYGMSTFKFVSAAGAALAVIGKYLNWF